MRYRALHIKNYFIGGKTHGRSAIKEEARMFRRKFITYEQAEVIYSISHRKLRDIEEKAGAVYRINDVSVLINKEIFDEFMEQFKQPAKPDVKI